MVPFCLQYLLITTMYLSARLLAKELRRNNCWKQYLHYQKAVCKVENNSLRVKFLENCKRADVIPKFLKFRVPNNGCFDEKSVHDFQRQLLNKEVLKAKGERKLLSKNLEEKRRLLREVAPTKWLPSIVVYTRNTRVMTRWEQMGTHNKKLTRLSEEQERPLFNVKNTVMETLSLGPKNSVLDRFDPKEILVEVDRLLYHCKTKNIADEIITDINVKTLTYIKQCKKMKISKNIQLTKKYLKQNDLLAIPFDKGVGICVMKKSAYHEKMDKIIQLPQFEKYEKPRKNAVYPVLKEEE